MMLFKRKGTARRRFLPFDSATSSIQNVAHLSTACLPNVIRHMASSQFDNWTPGADSLESYRVVRNFHTERVGAPQEVQGISLFWEPGQHSILAGGEGDLAVFAANCGDQARQYFASSPNPANSHHWDIIATLDQYPLPDGRSSGSSSAKSSGSQHEPVFTGVGLSGDFPAGASVVGYQIEIGSQVYNQCHFVSAPDAGTVTDGVIYARPEHYGNTPSC